MVALREHDGLGWLGPRELVRADRLGVMTSESQLDEVLAGCLKRLAKGDDSARGEILEVCNERLRKLSSRLLASSLGCGAGTTPETSLKVPRSGSTGRWAR